MKYGGLCGAPRFQGGAHAAGIAPVQLSMAKKNKKYRPPEKETTIENFYDLKTKEMDELVAALRGEEDAPPESLPSMNIAEVTGEVTEDNKKGKKQFDPYKRDKFSAIPFWVKALFIKFWFFGAVCYFALMGLGTFFTADDGSYAWIQSIELYLLCGAIMGIFVDCFVNPIFRMMESDRKEYNYFMMFPFPFKQFWTFFANIVYYLVVTYVVGLMYGLIFGPHFGGVEPLLFGVFCLVADMAFIGIKDLIVFLIKRAVKRAREKKAGASAPPETAA